MFVGVYAILMQSPVRNGLTLSVATHIARKGVYRSRHEITSLLETPAGFLRCIRYADCSISIFNRQCRCSREHAFGKGACNCDDDDERYIRRRFDEIDRSILRGSAGLCWKIHA